MVASFRLPDEILNRLLAARNVVAITGAGISAESGIPTFRGTGGLWKTYRAEDLATPVAFARSPALVWEWYDMRRQIVAAAEPNPGHLALAQWEDQADFTLVTQNIDGLHRRAGSRNLIEVHGNIWKARCSVCEHVFDETTTPLPLPELPHCPLCQALARPHVVWFGESYDQKTLASAMQACARADLCLVVGTSGLVQLPVWLAERARAAGALVMECNLEETDLTSLADVFLRGPAGEILPELLRKRNAEGQPGAMV